MIVLNPKFRIFFSFLKKNFSFVASIVFFFSIPVYAENIFPYIFDTSLKQKIEFLQIEKKFIDNDILILGEEHDDAIGHAEKLKLIKFLSDKMQFSISFEMFEKDQQIVLDEFLLGFVKEGNLFHEIRNWNSLKAHYGPIIFFAKEKQIPVIASNVPRRYANLVSRKGLEELWKLPKESRKYIPPLNQIQENITPEYEKKILSFLPVHNLKLDKKNFLYAQALWDSAMADSIYTECKTRGKKLVHINGRVHSDNRMGVTYRLQKMGLKVLTVSMFRKKGFQFSEDNSSIADIIYLTGE
ncbi:MAG: ChaN family lipoprotein [Leptospiraceae bacterium]|nr:ChaN family lipoprotein [Leptospiraceae bacterium]MCK6382032.1 ChaN family lipoprotein [Leptospiraceae bacterium]NUM40797.1 ChaN family lipoprotein [Leptospiraceae bacterium]